MTLEELLGARRTHDEDLMRQYADQSPDPLGANVGLVCRLEQLTRGRDRADVVEVVLTHSLLGAPQDLLERALDLVEGAPADAPEDGSGSVSGEDLGISDDLYQRMLSLVLTDVVVTLEEH